MDRPSVPLNGTLLDEAIVEKDQGQSREAGREDESELGAECQNGSSLDCVCRNVPSMAVPSVRLICQEHNNRQAYCEDIGDIYHYIVDSWPRLLHPGICADSNRDCDQGDEDGVDDDQPAASGDWVLVVGSRPLPVNVERYVSHHGAGVCVCVCE